MGNWIFAKENSALGTKWAVSLVDCLSRPLLGELYLMLVLYKSGATDQAGMGQFHKCLLNF